MRLSTTTRRTANGAGSVLVRPGHADHGAVPPPGLEPPARRHRSSPSRRPLYLERFETTRKELHSGPRRRRRAIALAFDDVIRPRVWGRAVGRGAWVLPRLHRKRGDSPAAAARRGRRAGARARAGGAVSSLLRPLPSGATAVRAKLAAFVTPTSITQRHVYVTCLTINLHGEASARSPADLPLARARGRVSRACRRALRPRREAACCVDARHGRSAARLRAQHPVAFGSPARGHARTTGRGRGSWWDARRVSS